MAEIEADSKTKRLSLSGLFLPLLIGATISITVGVFVIGYISLTEPHPNQKTYSLMNEKQQEDAATPADNTLKMPQKW